MDANINKICSLLPSTTEIVFALGLGNKLVAVTHECDYPEAATKLPTITSAAINTIGMSNRDLHNHVINTAHAGSSIYTLDHTLLEKLAPDLILTQELCDVCAVSYDTVQAAVREIGGNYKILSLEPTTLSAILETIEHLGEATGTVDKATTLIGELQQRIDAVTKQAQRADKKPRVFTLEWMDPPFAGGHWVPEMVRLAGGLSSLVEMGEPSRVVSWEEITAFDPEIIVVMPCGYHLDSLEIEFRMTAFPAEWGDLTAVRNGKVYGVDATAYFSRPGPRAVDGLEIMGEILHPELFPRRSSMGAWRVLDLKDCEQ
ncbi:MAG: cobalamin-binding protein [Chloroflexota bacterium]|nr:cobalamin-binding protein [Chloroflexota bacterium]